MKNRKLILIAADVVLLLVCVIQLINSKRNTVKDFVLKDIVDELVIQSPAEEIHLVLQNDKWYIGDKKYPANDNDISALVDGICTVKALDKVGKTINSNLITRYELTDEKVIKVTAKREGNVLRTVKLGKESNTGVQCYGTVDDGNDIYILAGNIRNTFDTSVDSLRSKLVYEYDKADVIGATVTNADGESWSVAKTGLGDNISWTTTPEIEGEIDTAKATEWFNQLASFTTTKWYTDEAANALNGEPAGEVTVQCGKKKIEFSLFVIKADPEIENSKDTYYAKCSETPYVFEVPVYASSRFTKAQSELVK